jgi:hypothetical protein
MFGRSCERFCYTYLKCFKFYISCRLRQSQLHVCFYTLFNHVDGGGTFLWSSENYWDYTAICRRGFPSSDICTVGELRTVFQMLGLYTASLSCRHIILTILTCCEDLRAQTPNFQTLSLINIWNEIFCSPHPLRARNTNTHIPHTDQNFVPPQSHSAIWSITHNRCQRLAPELACFR